ncbi:MAG: cell division protein FtsQ/DivIB [Acutalibacteraceae bacterium]
MSENGGFGSYFGDHERPRQVQNITSDRWPSIVAPISSTDNYTAYTAPPPPRKPQQRPVERGESQTKKAPNKNVSSGVTSGANPNAERKKTAKNTRGKTAKKSGTAAKAKAASPKGSNEIPISEMQGPGNNRAEKGHPAPVREKKPGKRAQKRSKRSCSRDNKRFLHLVRTGKSPDEARRIINRGKIRRRRRSAFFSGASLFLFAFLLVAAFCYSEGGIISKIIVDGDNVYTEKEIVDASNVKLGQNMLSVREREVNSSVTSILPFISKVSVDYQLPDTVKLDIVSAEEKYMIKNGKGYICVDKTGKVVSEKKKKLENGQYLILGMTAQEYTVGEPYVPIEDNQEKYKMACELAQAAFESELLASGVINVSDIREITFTYQSRIRIYFGKNPDFKKSVELAEAIIREIDGTKPTGYIDLSFSRPTFMQGIMEKD